MLKLLERTSQSFAMNKLSIKLNGDNFLAWKREALGAIKERNLEKFINEADFGGRPPKFINGKVSEEYKTWKEKDQVLYKWLLASLHPEFLHRIERCKHALELWMEIEAYFIDKEIEELRKKHKSLMEKNFKLKQRLRRSAEECLEISNENEAIEEELVKEHGPESVADILSMNPDTSALLKE